MTRTTGIIPADMLPTNHDEINLGKAPDPNQYRSLNKAALAWQEKFKKIREEGLIRAQAGEEPQWRCVHRDTYNAEGGAWTRARIFRERDRYMIPGVWKIQSRQFFDPNTGEFKCSETQVIFLGDPPSEQTGEIIVLRNTKGRPRRPSIPKENIV